MNKEQLPLITFSPDVFGHIAMMLDVKEFSCNYCGKKITKDNVGGFYNFGKKQLFCKDTFCLIQFVQETEDD